MSRLRHALAAAGLLLAISACGDDDGSGTAATDRASATAEGSVRATTSDAAIERGGVTLVTYDSFPESDTSLNEALAAFTDETGIAVEVLRSQDAGTMVSKAVLTAGNPEGDVMFGIDNSFLSRAVEGDVFEAYDSPGAEDIPTALRELSPDAVATPVDYGDVCINYDVAWFADAGIAPPTSLADLAEPAYRDLLVVENPATSSPGLAFVLATIAEFGEDGWVAYWQSLRDNGVQVVDGWTEAYYERFTLPGGDRPLVVSYGSSPPAEVLFADPPVDEAPTAVVEETCFRQVEFAGILRGTDAPEEARALLDFLVSPDFQQELALNLFVYPSNETVALPEAFTEHAVVAEDPYTLEPAAIAEGREAWIETWTDTVLR